MTIMEFPTPHLSPDPTEERILAAQKHLEDALVCHRQGKHGLCSGYMQLAVEALGEKRPSVDERIAKQASDAALGSVIRHPNLVQIGDLWICEDENQVMPDKIEFALLIQCSSAEQCRAAMKAGKIEFMLFEHYSQNGQDDPLRAGSNDQGDGRRVNGPTSPES